MKKKYLSLISILLVSLTGCNSTSSTSSQSTTQDSSSTSSSQTTSSTTSSSSSSTTSICEEHQFEENIKTPATCTTDGVKVLTCSVCGYKEEVTIPALAHNYDDGVVTKAATCTEEGETIYTCSRCQDTYTVAIPKSNHSYQNPTYTWNNDNKSCIASIECENCHEKFEETATESKITSTTLVEPTCLEKGSAKLTATFESDLFTSQEKTIELDALGHKYQTPTYNWNEDHTECVATAVCERNSEHIVTEKATISSSTIAAKCDVDGSTTYTATFTNSLFSEQTEKVVLPQTGHSWNEGTVTKEATCTEKGLKTYTCESCGATETEELPMIDHSYGEANYEWSSDYSTCTATRICSSCQKKLEEVATIGNGKVTKEVNKEVTCTEDGNEVYTAKFENTLFTSNIKNVIVPAIGHKYGETQRRYLEDSNSIEEYQICENDNTHENIVSTNELVSLDSFNTTKGTLHSYDSYIYRSDDFIALSFKTNDGKSWSEGERIKVYYDFGTDNYLKVSGGRVFDKTMGYIFLTPSSKTINVHEFYNDSDGKSADVLLDTTKMIATFNESLTIASIIIPTNLFSISVPEIIGITMGAQLDDVQEYKGNTSNAWGFTRVNKDNTLAGVKLNDCEAGSTAPSLSMSAERKNEKVIFTLKNTSKANWVSADRFYIYLDSSGKTTTGFNTSDGTNTYIMFSFTSATAATRYYRYSGTTTRINTADSNETIDGTTRFTSYYIFGNTTKIILDLSVMDSKLSTSYATSNLGIAYATGTSGINRQKNSYGGGDGTTKESGEPKDLSKYQRIDVGGNLVV